MGKWERVAQSLFVCLSSIDFGKLWTWVHNWKDYFWQWSNTCFSSQEMKYIYTHVYIHLLCLISIRIQTIILVFIFLQSLWCSTLSSFPSSTVWSIPLFISPLKTMNQFAWETIMIWSNSVWNAYTDLSCFASENAQYL